MLGKVENNPALTALTQFLNDYEPDSADESPLREKPQPVELRATDDLEHSEKLSSKIET
jgi:hypothetical protein